MAKPVTPQGVKPKYYATTAYKIWVRAQIKARGWSLMEFAQRLKRVDSSANATDGGLAQFLGREDEVPEPSNTTLMPFINYVLGARQPEIFDPEVVKDGAQDVVERVTKRWTKMSPRDRALLLRVLSDEDEE